jgi:hypothetical protein
MKKSQLTSGMRVQYASGERAIVFVGNFFTKNYGNQSVMFCHKDGFMTGRSYDEDLSGDTSEALIIVAVYDEPASIDPNKMLDVDVYGRLLWERKKDIPELTMEEVIEKLGYEIKIKK